MDASTPPPTNLRLFPALANAMASDASPPQPAGKAAAAGFKELLAMMVIGMSMPGGGGQTVGIGNMMAPLMLSLLEQVLSSQMEVEEGESDAAFQTPAEIPEDGGSDPVNAPTGRPIAGRLTQGSHAGHTALDYGAPVGTPVKATMDGEVVYAGWNDQGYGNLVIVENGPYRTYFAHLSKIPVAVGQRVRAREVIGISGNTGNSTGPHLHYEVRLNNQQLDPSRFIPS